MFIRAVNVQFVVIIQHIRVLHCKMSMYTGKTVVELRQLCQDKGLICSKLRKAEIIQLLLDNESVDGVVADGSSSGSVINDINDSGDDGDDIVDGEDDNDDAGDEVVLSTSNVKKSSSDVTSRQLQLKLKLTATQVRLAELDLEKMKLAANSRATTISSTSDSGKTKIDQSVKVYYLK